MYVKDIVSYIFGEQIFEENHSNDLYNKDIELQQMISFVENHVGNVLKEYEIPSKKTDDRRGRLGPQNVRFDMSTHHGLFIVSPDRLSVNSQSNFSTMRANTGIYEGKWMYEVQLGSRGVMQLGWGVGQCKYNQESGVGDVVNSYAYDGNRIRKWNVSTHKYGEAWLSGDIIGTTIDMDDGTICFFRNGKNLGVAFEKISMGPGIVYFPTVSLALSENLTANFGRTPMRYPVKSYQILQNAPVNQLEKSQILFEWLEKLLVQFKSLDTLDDTCEGEKISPRGFLLCLARHIFKEIGPLVNVPYVAEDIFVPFTSKLAKKDCSMLDTCLDLMWSFLEVHEIKVCLETTVAYLSSVFRQVSTDLEYPEQRTTLVLLNCFCQHALTRQYLLQFVLFDKTKLVNFIHVKPLDEDCLNNIVNNIWYETNPLDPSVEIHKTSYINACDKIKYWTSEVEALQVEFLTTLLNNTDGNSSTPTSRTIFLNKFRRFVLETLVSNRRFITYQTPLPVTLCFFHRLLVAFRVLWDTEVGTNPIFVPCRSFCDSSINYSNIERLGGVLSHLKKTFRNDLVKLLGTDEDAVDQSQDTQLTAAAAATTGTNNLFSARVADTPVISVFARMIGVNPLGNPNMLERIGYFPSYAREPPLQFGSVDPTTSLIELLDGVILFYYAAAKKQIAKVANIRDVITEYSVAMSDMQSRLDIVKKMKDEDSENIKSQLLKTAEIFQTKLTEQARHMAWVRAVVYSEEKQERIAWVLRTVLLTLKRASESENLFSFVPEFYLEVLADLINGLKNHIHPTVLVDKITDFRTVLKDIAQFLCDHFLDARIINANSKDTLITSLAGFASNSMTLDALESVTKDARLKVVSNLLKSYENRAWAQSNWILVRFWQGHGFAFRYEKSPHVAKKVGPKILTQESLFRTIKPCPSLVFQAHVKEILLGNNQATVVFLNSLLNQLNWVFSEFIEMVQEIHNVSSRPERVFIESRQLRICATCFELAVSLLRVIEMTASIASEVFTDFTLPSSSNLLARLCQLLCQILNRISMPTSSFQHVLHLDIPDLQTVDHFPISTAVLGILIALLKEDILLPESDEIPQVTMTIISEPSFQMSSLNFVLGEVKTNKIKNYRPFSLLNYEDSVSKEEILMVKKIIEHLDYNRKKLPIETPCDDDKICKICYAYPITAIFKPCGHSSCLMCIERHRLNSKTCFFCKSIIEQVIVEGKILHEFSSDSSIQSDI
ncbi:E3 ubiquitin-protein ligase RNF123 [Copidosoma floridanum]|uniref:E3 ubiquitin-protein ligase RNF123 n=1 Tax=Copidosoma floridanum TaxID=29053 RepID=UPI0006C9B1C5|nr:E3 ubiquitin-protein ligase RNF123 [Copidosoma floridanum]